MKLAIRGLLCIGFASILAGQTGCAVPQPRGHGKLSHRTEPQTKRGYWLYLPEDYVESNGRRADRKHWPLVVTFHGMKPWDNAKPQSREWQQEADRYGFIVIAPELHTCDSFMQYPLKDPTLHYVQKDEDAVLAIMSEVFRQTNADPSRVLATSWSCGGYLAHFMVNRHPQRFSCLAVRQSNFNEQMLNPTQVPKYRNMKIGIFFGENDFKACREESMRAVDWYRQYRFHVEAKYVGGLGHERTPQTAAAFFASTIGATPKTPPDLGCLVLRDVTNDDLRTAREKAGDRTPPRVEPASTAVAGARQAPPNTLFEAEASSEPAALRTPKQLTPTEPVRRAPSTVRTPPPPVETPKRPLRQPYSSGAPTPSAEADSAAALTEENPLGPTPAVIRIEGDTKSPAPLWVNLSVDLPNHLREGASILWTDNDRPMSANEFSTQSLLREPGHHAIEARIITADDRKIILRKTITVLSQTASQPSN